MSKIYYNQADSRWAKHPYPAPGYKNATIKTSGCGPTCAAMVVSSSGKEIIYPNAMADLSREKGFRVSGGTSWDLFNFVATKWGLETREVHSSYEAFDACKEGYMIVANVGPGLWTTGGHYILLVGTKNNKIEVYDPYLYSGKFNIHGRQGKVDIEGISCFVQIDDFKAYSECHRFYAYKINNNGEVNNADINKSNNINRSVGQIKKFKKSTYIYSNKDLTGTKYNYLTNTSIKILENVSENVDKICVIKTGRVGYVNVEVYA